MNVLALDYGSQRIGVAFGTLESGIAFAREALENDENVYERLQQFIESETVEFILVGLPYQQDGSLGSLADDIYYFIEQLRERFSVPVSTLDERYSTKIARSKKAELNLKKKDREVFKKSGQLDSLAAQVLLQEWLDAQ